MFLYTKNKSKKKEYYFLNKSNLDNLNKIDEINFHLNINNSIVDMKTSKNYRIKFYDLYFYFENRN